MAEEPICRILRETEIAGIHLMLERPLRVADLIRLMRTVAHVAEARETLCTEKRLVR